MPPVSISANEFFPTTSLTGGENPSVFRGKNIVIKGQDAYPYLAPYLGSKDLEEDYDISGETLTGSLAWSAADTAVLGTGTLFLTELRPGQMILAGSEIIVISQVLTDTAFTSDRTLTTVGLGQTAYFMRGLFEIDRKRASLRRGNGIKIDKGDILFVGDGELFLNGVGTGFDASRYPKRLQRADNGTYSEFPLGFATAPPLPIITATGGGTKGMMEGKYSFMISYYNSRTRGFSNPSEVIKQNGATVDLEIDTGGSMTRFAFDFTTAMDAMPDNADGFIVWGSQSGGGVPEVNATNFNNGAWYEAAKILVADLDGDEVGFVEYLDSELGAVASGDNDAPPECEFLCEFSNVPFYISALGNTKSGNPLGTSPGNYVLPTKNSNREAAPYAWRTSVGDEITGFALGVGRLFCLTTRGIPFITPTGNTEIARLIPTLQDYPFTSRPFWTKGGISPYNITVVQGDVFAFTGGQPLMSPRNATGEEFRPFELGAKVRDITKDWRDGYAFVQEDPKNQQVCFIQSAVRKNSSGYWESDILPYNLQTNTWMPVVNLTSTTRDMAISGVAIVNNRLEFLAGGRVSGGGRELKTYRYDELSGESISYYFTTQFSDFGEERRAKKITRQRVTGRFSTLTMQIHGADAASGNINISDLEAGTNSLSGNITFTGNGSQVERSREVRHLTKNIDVGAVRVSGVWDGTGEPDRIDEIVLNIELSGRER